MTVVYQHGRCSVHGGYELAVCVELEEKLVCVRCLLRRINNEAPEILLLTHSRHEVDHPNLNRAISWEVAPSIGCSLCDEAIIEAWLEVASPLAGG